MKYMSSRSWLYAGLALGTLGLTACNTTTAKEDLGLTRRTPDAFAVITRAPLDVPPDYYLRPPTPGAPRPQEQTAEAQAASAVFGDKDKLPKTLSKAEQELLQASNAASADPAIRSTIDAETKDIIKQDQPTVKKIFGIGGDLQSAPANVIDPEAEAKRLESEKAAK